MRRRARVQESPFNTAVKKEMAALLRRQSAGSLALNSIFADTLDELGNGRLTYEFAGEGATPRFERDGVQAMSLMAMFSVHIQESHITEIPAVEFRTNVENITGSTVNAALLSDQGRAYLADMHRYSMSIRPGEPLAHEHRVALWWEDSPDDEALQLIQMTSSVGVDEANIRRFRTRGEDLVMARVARDIAEIDGADDRARILMIFGELGEKAIVERLASTQLA